MKTYLNSNIILILSLIWVLGSCTSPYDEYLPEDGNSFLVLEGGIDNSLSHHQITLSKSIGYGAESIKEYYKDATIELFENEIIVGRYLYDTLGNYKLEIPYKGKSGHKYNIKLRLNSGQEYLSESQMMPEIPESINEIKPSLGVGYANNEYKKQESLELLAGQHSNQGQYYRFDVKSTLLYTYLLMDDPSRADPLYHALYMWKTYPNYKIKIIYSQTGGTIKNISLVSINSGKDFYENDNSLSTHYYSRLMRFYKPNIEKWNDPKKYLVLTYPNYNGFLCEVTTHVISREEYTYWEDIKDQESADGQLFAPMVTQIRGNMKAVNGTDKEMLGLFKVSANNKVNVWVTFPGDRSIEDYSSKILDTAYEISSSAGWSDTIPSFWIK